VEKRVLDSNPILEAFGNAKTLRNENSSRFGKFICMQFNSFGELVGAKIDTYLLEKVRLVNQGKGERNYHIFYQMCAGGVEEEKERWGLTEAKAYHYLNQSDCFVLREINDVEEYGLMRGAMDTMGISREDQAGIFDALAAILHLSNLKFADASGTIASLGESGAPAKAGKGAPAPKPAASGTTSGECTFGPDTTATVERIAVLLGITPAALQSSLTSKEIVARTERYKTFFSLQQCCASAEAMTKALYGKLFLYLVYAINRQIRAPSSSVSSFIGVLDIFGFEHFETNSFEQLCINYANETLQQQFNQFVFKLEQAEYEREMIKWSMVDFPDNQVRDRSMQLEGNVR
jgi:myosin-5